MQFRIKINEHFSILKLPEDIHQVQLDHSYWYQFHEEFHEAPRQSHRHHRSSKKFEKKSFTFR